MEPDVDPFEQLLQRASTTEPQILLELLGHGDPLLIRVVLDRTSELDNVVTSDLTTPT